MSDIVERLRSQSILDVWHPMMLEAAAEILRLRAENEKLRASNAVFQHHLEALHEEMLGRIDSKIEDGQNHTDETLFLDGLLQSNLQILELCRSKSAAAALKETGDE